jgi:hypothetical protein
MAQQHAFGVKAFFIRFIYLFVLVLITYNPFHYSLFHWIQNEHTPLSIGSGILLIMLWSVVLWFVYLGSGFIGLFMGSVMISLLLWMAKNMGMIHFDNTLLNVIFAEISLSLLFSLGLSWAHIRRRISGQLSTDDIGADV